MANYMTAQRKQLFAFLQENPDRQFSAKQIADSLSGSSVSLSAVYRNLTYLQEKGLINRFTKEGSREIFYQYIHSEDCRNCIHMNCIKCGRTFHMNAHIADRMLEDILRMDGFQIRKEKSVLYGICKSCI
ncbi:MAG: transcriptional repressor [Hungatella sp.]|nr:transcriptional repressor [Hungatella sp.]MDR2022050.1 transcriptional repressor [Hungatella sp.]